MIQLLNHLIDDFLPADDPSGPTATPQRTDAGSIGGPPARVHREPTGEGRGWMRKKKLRHRNATHTECSRLTDTFRQIPAPLYRSNIGRRILSDGDIPSNGVHHSTPHERASPNSLQEIRRLEHLTCSSTRPPPMQLTVHARWPRLQSRRPLRRTHNL